MLPHLFIYFIELIFLPNLDIIWKSLSDIYIFIIISNNLIKN